MNTPSGEVAGGLPLPPPWLADLPRDLRGFLVPAEAAWREGRALLSKVPIDQKLALALTRCCAVCGYGLTPGRPVYRAFSQRDSAQIRGYERDLTFDLHGPGHKSCMLYSTFVCPYLREPGAQLRRDSVIAPGAPRGTRPAVMGFADFALLMYNGPHNPLDMTNEATMPQFGYRQLTDDLPFKSPADLRVILDDAVVADAPLIDLSKNRQYWDGSAARSQELADLLAKLLPVLARSKPVAHLDVGSSPFVALEMPPNGVGTAARSVELIAAQIAWLGGQDVPSLER